jgi:hypothetical protein
MKGSSFEVRVLRIDVGRTSGHAGFVGVGVADVGSVQYNVNACLDLKLSHVETCPRLLSSCLDPSTEFLYC